MIGRAAAKSLLARLGEAFAALAEAEPLAGAASDDRSLAEIRYLRGNLFFARGELEACRREHAAALEVAQRLNSAEWRAHALSGLADAQYMNCRMATALKLFAECVELNEAARQTRMLAANRVMMGHCRIYVCEFDTGLDEMVAGSRSLAGSAIAMGKCSRFSRSASAGWRPGATARRGKSRSSARPGARLNARRYEAIILGIALSLRWLKVAAPRRLRSRARD